MNRSQISNDFNFQNELDISNTRKDKTEHFFSKEGFQFEDFMNVGDRTFKSDKFDSKLNQNTSKISRDNSRTAKEDQEELPSKLLEDFYSTHNRPSRQPQETSKQQLTISNLSQKPPPAASPKFAETTKSIPLSPRKQEFTLRRQSAKKSEALVKREGEKGPEEEWVSLEGQIRFYLAEAERVDYERNRLDEEAEQLMTSFNPASHQAELDRNAIEIKEINRQIEEQRQLEGQLSKMVQQLQEEYDALITSVKTSQFPRPTRVGDDAKALIDDINSLKAELEAIERDDGSLNLSSTLVGVPSSYLKTPSGAASPRKQLDEAIRERIEEMEKIHRESEYPRFLLNVKMACLKSEWALFVNSELQVNVSYRQCCQVQLRIGNKLATDLERFSLRHDGALKLQGQTIAAKSYYNHCFEVSPSTVVQLFSKVELSYKMLNQEQRKIVLFVPLGLTTFGEFSPVTPKQFQRDANNAVFETVGGFRPIDRKIITSLCDLEVFMPNLIISEDTASGMFLLDFPNKERMVELVVFRQRGETLSVSTRSDNWPMVRLLEFIFTL